MSKTCRDCGGELVVSEDEYEIYCCKCGLVHAELVIEPVLYDKETGEPLREFAQPFYWMRNFVQTMPLFPSEIHKILSSKSYKVRQRSRTHKYPNRRFKC